MFTRFSASHQRLTSPTIHLSAIFHILRFMKGAFHFVPVQETIYILLHFWIIVLILGLHYGNIRSQNGRDQLSACPRYEGQLIRMAEPIPPSGQSSSYSLTTLSSSSSTDRRAETDRKIITTRIAVAHHFRCRLRRRERELYTWGHVQSANITPTRTTSG